MFGKNFEERPVDKFPSLQRRYETLEQYEGLHLSLVHEMLTKYGNGVFDVDKFMVATLYRSVNLVDGIIVLSDHWNAVCALPLLRLQIENLYKLYYIARDQENRHVMLHAWQKGVEWRKLKNNEGHALTDRFLCEFAGEQYSWLPALYRKTCKQVHLSITHFGHAMSGYNSKEDVAKISFAIGSEHWAESLIDQFLYDVGNVTDTLLKVVVGWIELKGKIVKKRKHS
ncbi:MAG: hypothetical protein WCV62_01670 [Candidatus Peribacteraceae bacterium]|jgi:hypothetical protein